MDEPYCCADLAPSQCHATEEEMFSLIKTRMRSMLNLGRVEQAFWIIFVLLPIVMQFLSYNWLPNESFDPRKHEKIHSYQLCIDRGGGDECRDEVDEWRDKATGETFFREDFAEHLRAEWWRMLFMDLSYGLIGCLAFAYFRWRRDQNNAVFFQAFGKAVFCAVAVSVLMSSWVR
jgi:hypothetical protein